MRDLVIRIFNCGISLRRLARKAGTYTFFSLLNKSVPFLLLPILTKYLSPADYGMVALFSVLTLFLMPIIGLNANTTLVQRYFKSDVSERQALLSSSYVMMIIIFLAIFLLVLIFGSLFSSLIKLPKLWLLIAVAAALMGMVFTMLITLFQIRQEVFRFGMTQIVYTAINVGLSLTLVVGFKYGWEGRLSGIVIASGIMMFYSIYSTLRQEDWKMDMVVKPAKLQLVAKNGLFLLPASLAGAAVVLSDRFFLVPMVSLEQLGLYSVAIMFCQVLAVLYEAIGMAYLPIFFEKVNSTSIQERKKAIVSSYGIVVIYVLIAMIFVWFSPMLLTHMLDERYHSAASFFRWLAFGYAAMAGGSLFYNHIIAKEKNRLIMVVSLALLIATILTNYILIKFNGAMGASQALLILGVLYLGLNMVLSVRLYGFPIYANSRRSTS